MWPLCPAEVRNRPEEGLQPNLPASHLFSPCESQLVAVWQWLQTFLAGTTVGEVAFDNSWGEAGDAVKHSTTHTITPQKKLSGPKYKQGHG